MAQAMDVDETSEYELSTQLSLHQAPVRCLVTDGNDSIVSAGTKEEFIEWSRIEETESSDANVKAGANFMGRMIFDKLIMHPLTFCLVKHTLKDDNLGELYISGGSDSRAIVWNSRGEAIQELTEHKDSVNSIDITDEGAVVTGSYDGTAKIWKDGKCVATLGGHQYGVEVCSLESGELVTGSHKDLHFWTADGKKIKTAQFAHDHVIRKIRRHPLGFVTCANDGYVKLWSNQGENLRSVLAHPENGETPSFIYGLYSCADGQILSCGEDGTAKIFSADGYLQQSLRHPGAVWAVSMLPNGDIVTGCADRTVRVWSKNVDRQAPKEAIDSYYQMLEEFMKHQGASGVDESQLEDPEVLNQPGKPGEFKMVRDPKRGPSVFQWDAQKNEWTYIGEIMGKPETEGKPKVNGIEYDYVTYIDLNGEDKRPLGMNKDDDPKTVAREWCTIQCVDLDMVPRITEHLTPMVDPVARAARVERERIAASKKLVHIPGYLVCKFEINGKMQLEPMRKKILEFNNALVEQSIESAVDPKNAKDSQALETLFQILANQKTWHVDEFPSVVVDLIAKKLLQWPTQQILPIMDMVRVLMLHQSAVDQLVGNTDIRAAILKHISGGDDTNPHIQMIVSRLLSNYLAKRNRSDDERQGRKCPQDLVELLQESLSNLASAASNPKASIYTAYIMLAHNVMLWYSKFKIDESDLYLVISSAIFELLSEQKLNDKIQYYCLSIVGTVAWCSDSAKTSIKELYSEQLRASVDTARHNAQNAACREVGKDLFNLFEME